MEIWLIILTGTFLFLAIAVLYTLFCLKKIMARVESLIRTLDENMPGLLEESKATLKSLRALLEDLHPLKEDVAGLLKTSHKVTSLFEILSPDPNVLRTLLGGLKTVISSLFLRFFSRWEGKKENAKDE